MKKLICAAVLVFCLFWILGSVGMLECDMISISGFLKRSIPALIALGGSFWIGGLSK